MISLRVDVATNDDRPGTPERIRREVLRCLEQRFTHVAVRPLDDFVVVIADETVDW